MDFAFAERGEILEALGQRLRQHRLRQGLPQKDLAQMAGLALNTIKALESRGQCSLDSLLRVVQALGLTDALQGLFEEAPQSIAQMEQMAKQATRQRASRTKRP